MPLDVFNFFARLEWCIRQVRRTLKRPCVSFHRAAAATIYSITAAPFTPRYPNGVAIPVGEAGRTRAGVILCHQVRTISLARRGNSLTPIGYLTDPDLRNKVRGALARQLGLDIPSSADGATGRRVFEIRRVSTRCLWFRLAGPFAGYLPYSLGVEYKAITERFSRRRPAPRTKGGG